MDSLSNFQKAKSELFTMVGNHVTETQYCPDCETIGKLPVVPCSEHLEQRNDLITHIRKTIRGQHD